MWVNETVCTFDYIGREAFLYLFLKYERNLV